MSTEIDPSQVRSTHLDAGRIMGQNCRWRWFLGWCAVLLAVFGGWVLDWGRFALNDSLASYVLLIPAVSAYLIRQRCRDAVGSLGTSVFPGSVALTAGLAFAVAALLTKAKGSGQEQNDYISAAIAGFILCGIGGGFLFLGKEVLKPHAFPIAFLVFAIPIPSWGVNMLEMFFQHTSAEVAAVMIDWAGIPNLRNGLVFKLPGLTIQVAQECSGIRSSIVLFITSVLAGAIMLQRPWARGILALTVIPLGILRNGFRILTISLLCVHVGPEMIDSPIHHRGGPLFFALSLVPFLGLLLLLRKWENPAKPARK